VTNLGYTAIAQTVGAFSPTGEMTTPRASHTATLLLNGKVLIAGGFSLSAFAAPVASAELYDPSTGMFTPTGDMTTPRRSHTATLLADGRVLIAGGYGDASGDSALRKAEVYDPSTGTFTATGDMSTAGFGSAVLLPNGTVLIAGNPTAELYDPVTGTFAPTGSYTGAGRPALIRTTTLLPDRRVLITGCTGLCQDGLAELYDTRDGTFRVTGPMNGWANENTATLLLDGKVLFAGNLENDGSPAEVEIYDPAAGTFTRLANAIGPHEFSAAVLLPDGTVLITGGQVPGGAGAASAELYVPASETFYPAGAMTTWRHSHTATLLPDGTVLIAGGWSNWPSPTSSAEIYRPPVLHPGPVLFSLSGDGQGQGAILHPGTANVASAGDPAVVGEVLEIYCAGLADAGVIPPQVAIGGRMADVLFFGGAPGWSGLDQVNVRVPSGITPGPAVPVRLTYLWRPSNEVSIGVQ
jgi:hypothetical protein